MRRLFWILAIISLIISSCGGNGPTTRIVEGLDTVRVYQVHYELPVTLLVGTLYSPTSYFIYRDEEMGIDYDMITRFAAAKGMRVKIVVAPSLSAAVEMLDSGQIDILATEVPVTSDYKDRVVHCGLERITTQVLVQPKQSKEGLVKDVTDLVDRDIYVEKDSKYQQRIENLSEELGGGIRIHPIDRDTLITEDLIAMVSEGLIPLTVVDSDIASLNKTYYEDLDITLDVSFPQRASWAVAPRIAWMADTVNTWIHLAAPQQERADLMKRYFEEAKIESRKVFYNFKNGRISAFDNLFKKHAKAIGWDWRLLAAQGFIESHFDSTAVSWAGARGLMQIMPRTAKSYGLEMEHIHEVEPSIATAVKVIRDLNRSLSAKVKDPEERKKFIVAAYNSGLAHILDAIALAEKYGLNPQVWDKNVEEALMMKSKPEYYNDPVCKYGYFRGRQTFNYVIEVYRFYEQAKTKIPK